MMLLTDNFKKTGTLPQTIKLFYNNLAKRKKVLNLK